MEKNKYFSISVLMPTLNAEKFLKQCLESIITQNYPKNEIEIIIADGGSTDKTVEIARKFGAKVFKNPLKTAEAGKAVALKQAKGELVALIDSDNILPDKNWFKRMVEPFGNKEILGSEPWEFTYRRKGGFIDRYCALMGMNDPICYFVGNYDRLNVLSGEWTGLKLEEEDKGKWLEIVISSRQKFPTIGANGVFFRRKVLQRECRKEYLFDIDLLVQLAKNKSILFAKIKIGIIHLYCGSDIRKFIRKQRRRVKDYLFFQKSGIRQYPWQEQNLWGIVKFVFCCLTVFPLFWQSFKGYFRRRDSAWFFHPLACWITLFVYSSGKISSFFRPQFENRTEWKQ